ncbi:MAG TPA: FAD-dependent oxidoreductase [Fimbriimonadaceae bacterium]|nr:FAD-dependent oxidoreductase [Fimbriimonadaceae bacterium]HRJ32720.1 FAD-dependent oxidoreductase [Fimbriimonadaceae bacterium]
MKSPGLSSMRRLSGFGMRDLHDAYVIPIDREEALRELLDLAKISRRQITLRGAGQSYGDAAGAPEGWIADLRPMNQILNWDQTTGLLTAQAGVTLATLCRHVLADGFWPAVVSGTSAITLGGALAMNIHGKNAFREGTLGESVTEIVVMGSRGIAKRLTPDDRDFWIWIGGAGQFGAILQATLRMKRLPSAALEVRVFRASSLQEQFEIFERETADQEYCVGWLDGFASGEELGRGLIHSARSSETPSSEAELRRALQPRRSLASKILLPERRWGLGRMLQFPLVRKVIHALKSDVILHDHFRQNCFDFHFLLDALPNWQKVFSPGGLIQFQPFVPWDDALNTFRTLLQDCQDHDFVPSLAVLKKHRASPFALDYAGDSYSLALDFPVQLHRESQLLSFLEGQTERLLMQGSRFYFAKDILLQPQHLGMFLAPSLLHELQDAKSRWDPENLFTSAQAERMGWQAKPNEKGSPTAGTVEPQDRGENV